MPRRPKLTRAQVLEAALALVDEGGLESLSMRRIGQALGVEAMSLYNHVPNKAAVLDGLHEVVLSGMEMPDRTGDWRHDARAMAVALRRALVRHPRALPLFATRPAVTRAALAYVEAGLEILAAPFPDLDTRLSVFQVLLTYVVGHTLSCHAEPGEPVGDPVYSEFPILARVAPLLYTHDTDAEFALGLDALLRGLRPEPARAGV